VTDRFSRTTSTTRDLRLRAGAGEGAAPGRTPAIADTSFAPSAAGSNTAVLHSAIIQSGKHFVQDAIKFIQAAWGWRWSCC
jgi:hypothetical protein